MGDEVMGCKQEHRANKSHITKRVKTMCKNVSEKIKR